MEVKPMVGPKPRDCGCKGIRSCKLCETKIELKPPHLDLSMNSDAGPETIIKYCLSSKKLLFMPHQPSHCSQLGSSSSSDGEFNKMLTGISSNPLGNGNLLNDQVSVVEADNVIRPISPLKSRDEGSSLRRLSSNHENFNTIRSTTDDVESVLGGNLFEGIDIIEDFITAEEEESLVSEMMSTVFVNSQSGRRKQDFGPKVNFKRRKVKTAGFSGLPAYSQQLYERMKEHQCLKAFEPVELCNLEYCAERGAHIDPHLDDAWLWGERLVTLNLLSDSILTFTKDSLSAVQIQVPLVRRSLIVVSGPARYDWKHGIQPGDVKERRIAMTFRELSDEFKSNGDRKADGVELLQLALTFQGHAIVS